MVRGEIEENYGRVYEGLFVDVWRLMSRVLLLWLSTIMGHVRRDLGIDPKWGRAFYARVARGAAALWGSLFGVFARAICPLGASLRLEVSWV